MTDPGLTNRLRQHSRRAGVMVGISMALTIAICLGGFVWIFTQVDPFLRDFVSAEVEQEPEEEARPTVRAGSGNGEQASEDEDDEEEPEVAAADDDEPTPPPEPDPTPTPVGFQPDYQSSSLQTINLRSGPSRATALVSSLPPSTPLQYLDEDEPAADPALDGNRWMRFSTADGLEGWMREIDVEQFVP